MGDLTHLDDEGRARMVDVGDKPVTDRAATAEALVSMLPETRDALFSGGLPKGDAVAVARLAAIGGAKRTADLVPLCHPLLLSAIDVAVLLSPMSRCSSPTWKSASRSIWSGGTLP